MIVTDLHTNVRIIEEQPGDGTRYVIVVVGPLPGYHELGTLGSVTDGYLVVTSWGETHLFWAFGSLAWRYVQDKLGGTEQVARQLTRMIGNALGREVLA